MDIEARDTQWSGKSFLKRGLDFLFDVCLNNPFTLVYIKKICKLSHEKHLTNKTSSMGFCCWLIYEIKSTLKNEIVN